MRPPPEVDNYLRRAAEELVKRINIEWPDNGLHRRGQPSTGRSDWTLLKSTNGWVATSGRRYGQWVQPVGIAGKAHGNPPHGFEVSRRQIPQMVNDTVIALNKVTGRNVRVNRPYPIGRRIEFRMDPVFPDQILVELYKNGVSR